MVHLALNEVDDDNVAAHWGDHVTDEEYKRRIQLVGIVAGLTQEPPRPRRSAEDPPKTASGR